MMSKFGATLYPSGLINTATGTCSTYMLHGKKEASSVREVRAWYAKKGRNPNPNANVAYASESE